MHSSVRADVQPAMDLIARNFGKDAVHAFNLTIGEDACDVAEGNEHFLPFEVALFQSAALTWARSMHTRQNTRREASAWLL